MHVKSLVIENFLSIERASLTFESGLYLVEGQNLDMAASGNESNGTGKSALFGEALEWVLWGSLSRSSNTKADDVVNRSAGRDCLGRVVFVHAESEWVVQRTRKHTELGNSLSWSVNGVDMTKHDTKVTKAELSDALPVSHSVYRHAIQIGQGMQDTFLSLTETEKQDLLCKILDLTLYDQASDRAKSHVSELDGEVRAMSKILEDLISSVDEWERRVNDSEVRLVECEKDVSEGVLAGLKERLASVQRARGQNEARSAEIDENTGELTSSYARVAASLQEKREQEYQSVNSANEDSSAAMLQFDSAISEIGKREEPWVAKRSDLLAHLRHSRADLSELASSPDNCPTCDAPLKGRDALKVKILEKKKAILEEERGLLEVEDAVQKFSDARDKTVSAKVSASEQWAVYIGGIRDIAHKNCGDLENEVTNIGKQLEEQNKLKEEMVSLIQEGREVAANIERAMASAERDAMASLSKRAKAKEGFNLAQKILKEKSSERDRKEDELRETSRTRSHWSYWKEAIPNLRAAAMEDILIFLNQRISAYLDEFSSGVMGLKVYQEAYGKKSKIKIDLRTPGGTYAMSSGGERKRVDLAVYLALSDLLHSASGFSCNILVADEIMDGLSPEGVKKFSAILRRKADEGLCVFVISHNPAARQMVDFDSVFTIERRDGKANLKEEVCLS